jgi:predicted mannosyl-3-phosphoglycerate phosphatase (HAD superfamily)
MEAVDKVKVIFLDIDGVLCNHESISAGYKTRTAPEQDPYGPHVDCVAALNRIIKETGAKIVVSSTWRHAGAANMRGTLKRW